jgi:teichuronic acid biosynthesis glycosyltransferase TuaC
LRSACRDTAHVRALVVSNMWPTEQQPALGSFVRDQVEALQRRDDVELELVTFAPGALNYLRALPALARERKFDVVHAHFGLTAWPALAAGGTVRGVTLHGNDLMTPRSRRLTLAVLPRYDVVGVPSEHAIAMLPTREAARASVLPCGINLHDFQPLDRAEARRALGLDPQEPFAVFPFDPARPVKRHDRAVAAAGPHQLHALGFEPRDRMRLWLNAASVVICPSEWETFGMAAVEAVACGTATIGTPTGVHEDVLGAAPWCDVRPWDERLWRGFVDGAIAADQQHADGRAHALRWSSDLMAERLVQHWRAATEARRQRQG